MRATPLRHAQDTLRASRRGKAPLQAAGNSIKPTPIPARPRGRPRKDKGLVNDEQENMINETRATTSMTPAPRLTAKRHAAAAYGDPVKRTEVPAKSPVAPKLASALPAKTPHVGGGVRKRPRRRISLDPLPPLEEL